MTSNVKASVPSRMIDCSPENGLEWSKHVGTNLDSVLLYFIPHCPLGGFILINSSEGRWSKCPTQYILLVSLSLASNYIHHNMALWF